MKKFARKVNKQKRPLSKIEIMKVMDFYSNKNLNVKMCRDICIVLFCWYALLRYDDVSQLKVEDLKIDNDVYDIFIKAAKNDRFRNGQQISIRLSSKCLYFVNKYFVKSGVLKEKTNFLFPSVKRNVILGGKKLNYEDMRLSLLDLLVEVGIDTRDVSTHSLRVGGCTEVSRAGVPDYLVDAFGRWAYNSNARARYQRCLKGDFLKVSEVLNK